MATQERITATHRHVIATLKDYDLLDNMTLRGMTAILARAESIEAANGTLEQMFDTLIDLRKDGQLTLNEQTYVQDALIEAEDLLLD